jgi:hypothetical protein
MRSQWRIADYPWCLRFVGNRLWVGDINGDFIYGKRELPDGFIVTLAPH